MSSRREEVDQGPCKWAWRKQRRRFCRETRKILGESHDPEYVLRHGVGNTNRRSLERVTRAGSVLEVDFKFKCKRLQSNHTGAHCCQACALSQDKMEA